MMRKPSGSALGVVSLLCILLLAGCTTAPVLHYLTVAPAAASISVGQQQSFTATAYYSDGTSQNVTASSSVTWASSNNSIATVTSGVATGVAGGTVTITASVGKVKSTATLTVTGVQSIAVTPAFATIGVEGTQAFKAMATELNPDGTVNPTPVDVTLLASWNSSNLAAATIDSTQDATNGTATAVATGLTQITASYQGITSNIAYLTVGTPTPIVVQLTVAPLTATIAAGQTVAFAATEVLSTGATQPLSGPVTWSISCTPANAATIGATTGLAVASVSGAGASCTVTATETAPNAVGGTATLSITAAVARFAYIVNNATGTISAYAANVAGGALTFLAKYPTSAGPWQAIVHPSGKFLYFIDGASGVHVCDINPVTGALLIPGVDVHNNPLPIYQAGTGGVDKGVIDPSGSFLYVVDAIVSSNSPGSNEVWGFTINQADGSLTATSPANFAVGTNPTDVLVDHSGTNLYVINQGDQDISGFTITPANGALVANTAATAPYTSGSLVPMPTYGTVDPTNTYLYVPTGDGNVSSFQITSNGQLSTPATVSPVAGAVSLTNIVIDPGDKYIYVVDTGVVVNNQAAPSNIYAFQVGTGGALGNPIGGTPPTPIPAGITSFGMTIDPTSTLLAVDNNFSDTISLFTIGSTGALTSLVPASTGGGPYFLAFDIGTAAATVTPAEVVTANNKTTTGDISAFTVASGVLTADTHAPYTGVAGNSQIGSSVTGSLFFTGSASGKQLAGYGFNAQNTPAIAALSGSPYSLAPAGAAGTVIADPSNLFAYVADTTNGQVDIYSYNSTTNSLAAGTPATGLTGLQSLVSDPQANFVFGLSSSGSITAMEPVLSTGTLSGTPQSIAGNWTMGAVDASGQYLLAVDSAANIHMYSISPAVGGSSDGALTGVGTSATITGTLTPVPAAIAFDPLDRFVVVTDAANDAIIPFLFTYSDPNSSTPPALTAGTPVGVPSAPGQVTIDPTGQYLFVALAGSTSPASNSGVAVYTVAVSGGAVTLTAVTGSPFTTGTGASGTAGVGVINSVQ
jgi:6-phosphogluconolactonase (cycloisomerase 2 family)